ncbi:hypothetical protein QFC19_008639 [Naganishia cerealis]|uniref:Uncharacterized protein n=1 Tax=Naganishia cerealis TaxID=610337 RepID=A0ACC2V132_9TREE|nr:hypothetical protein QFC19_008639 [Naganishia cerealis]
MSAPKLAKGPADFKLLTAGTPNGYKASILLEELVAAYPGFTYDFEGISFKSNEQKEEWFLQVNPNGRIPAAIVYPKEQGGKEHYVFESASISLWLIDHIDTAHKLSFEDEYEKSEALSWLFFMHGGLGPMQGYREETKRLYSVLEDRLAGRREDPATSEDGKTHGREREYVVGKGKGKYSFVDVNIYPWVRTHAWAGVESLAEYPNLSKWLDRVAARPAVKRGLDIPEKNTYNPAMTEEEQTKKAEAAKQWIHGK